MANSKRLKTPSLLQRLRIGLRSHPVRSIVVAIGLIGIVVLGAGVRYGPTLFMEVATSIASHISNPGALKPYQDPLASFSLQVPSRWTVTYPDTQNPDKLWGLPQENVYLESNDIHTVPGNGHCGLICEQPEQQAGAKLSITISDAHGYTSPRTWYNALNGQTFGSVTYEFGPYTKYDTVTYNGMDAYCTTDNTGEMHRYHQAGLPDELFYVGCTVLADGHVYEIGSGVVDLGHNPQYYSDFALLDAVLRSFKPI